MEYKCSICGVTFESTHKSIVCKDCKQGECVVCGKIFTKNHPYTQKTCSAKCRGIYRKESGIAKEIARKATNTYYKHKAEGKIVKKQYTKICKWCGKEFVTSSPRRVYCGDDWGNCPICGKHIKIKDINIGPQACSEECRLEAIRRTNLKKYGVECVFQSDIIKDKIKETNLDKYGETTYSKTDEFKDKFKHTMNEKYGVDSPLQNESIKNKFKQTNQLKYGGNSPLCSDEVKDKARQTLNERYGGYALQSDVLKQKIKDTNLKKYGVEHHMQNEDIKNNWRNSFNEKYGVDNPFKVKEIQEKIKSNNLDKYGSEYYSATNECKQKVKATCLSKYNVDNVFKNSDVKNKIVQTNIEKYGFDNPMKNDEIKAKVETTCIRKYGSTNYLSSKSSIHQRMTDNTKLDDFLAFKSNPSDYVMSNYSTKPTELQLAEDLGVDIATVSRILIDCDLRDIATQRISTMENQIVEFINSLNPNIIIQRNVRNIISPLELDLYLPDYDFAIECNPTCTHNSSIPDPWGGVPKHYKYHQNKSLRCNEQGIFLFHVFGYEWNERRDVIKSMIANNLSHTKNKIFARNTYVDIIPYQEATEFLNLNHRQGTTSSKYYIGLRTINEKELVSLMTFNKIRATIGKSSNITTSTYELSRFCSKLNTSVVGGASKLFKYFINNYDFDKIVSFSDIAHTSGKLYKVLGFEKISSSDPSYVWVNSADDSYLNRVTCQKRNLHKLFNDTSIDLSKTEKQIMEEHNYVQVFDSGVIRWEWVAKIQNN